MWKTVESLLSSIAPTIASALGGPLAGGAVTELEKAIGLDQSSSPDAIKHAIVQANPETIEKLKEAELAFKQHIADLNVDIERLNEQDIQNARARQIAVRDKIPAVLGLATVVLFLAYAFAVTFFQVPHSENGIIQLVFGWVGSMATSVMTYYFGSSNTSDKKDMLDKMVNN